MSFLIVFACAIAAASAGNLIAPSYLAQHLPLIGPNGVPLETPEVQQAKAVHLAHKLEAHARNGDLAYTPLLAPITSLIAPTAYTTSIIPTAFHGVPLDTPEVTAAKLNHFAAHAQATYGRAIIPAALNGVPLDTPEVTAAKINHFAAHAQALARNGQPAVVLNRKRRGILAAPLAYSTSYNTQLIGGGYAYSRPLYTNTYAAAYSNPYQYYRYY